MSRRLLVPAFAAGLLVAGPACRLFHRDSCGSRRDLAPPVCDSCASAVVRSGVPVAGPVGGVTVSDSFGSVPVTLGGSSFGGPAVPVGDPVPVKAPAAGPANELPFPTLPNPNVPENPAAATGPVPAIPPSARTTAEPRLGR